MRYQEMESAVEAILFAAGDPVPIGRIAAVLGAGTAEVAECALRLAEAYESEGHGIRLARMEDSLQLCSAPEHADLIIRALENRKPPKLTQPALEALAIVAYHQPVTRAYVDEVRGVDSSYTVGVLRERGLIEQCGRLDVPGRPSLYRTSDAFLRTMGVASLDELPPLPDISSQEGITQLTEAIEALKLKEIEDGG